MSKHLVITISSILFIILLSGMIVGCTAFSPIVGKWQDTKTKDTMEFTNGGDIIMKPGREVITGKYELIGSDVVKVRFEGFTGAWMSIFGGDTWQYKISSDTLTITVSGKSSVLKRISK